MSRNQKLALLSILCAQAVVISLFERQLPSPFMIVPGAKIGLANVVTLIALSTLSAKDTIKIIGVRLVLTALLTGTMSILFYGTGGALLSFLSMYIANKFFRKYISLIGISVIGGFMHNLGQLLVVAFVARTWTVLLYLPLLSIAGIIAGVLVGLLAIYLLNHLERLDFMKLN